MAKQKMTKDEALQMLPRRARRWRQLSDAAEALKQKLKPVVSEIKVGVKVLPGKVFEGAGVRAKFVEVEGVEKADPDNLAAVARTVRVDELDVICPRTIDLTQLESRYPDLVKELSTKKSERFEIDVLQVALPATA